MKERHYATLTVVLTVSGLVFSVMDGIDDWTDLCRLVLCLGWLALLVWWWIRTERFSSWGLALGWAMVIVPFLLTWQSGDFEDGPWEYAGISLSLSGLVPAVYVLPERQNRWARRRMAVREARLREERESRLRVESQTPWQ